MNKLSLQLTILFIITWLNGYTNFQQPFNYRFQYLLIEDGLPQNTINAIAKDGYGFMWFGTNNGISRYDGYSFESFKSDESQSNSLPDNMISSIEPGDDNRLWIGSSNGLSYFDPLSGRIIRYAPQENGVDKITKVTSIVADTHQIWVGTSNNGLFLLSKNSLGNYVIKKHYSEQNKNLANNQINVVYRSKSNQLYAGTQNGAFIYFPKQDRFGNRSDKLILPQNITINDIFESSTGDLYFSTNDGVVVYWKENRTPEQFTTTLRTPFSLEHNTVNKVSETANGKILVGSLGGLQQFDTFSGQFYSYPEEGPAHFKLNNKFVNTLFCDDAGNVWVGTEKGGINKFNVFQNQFDFYAHDPNNPNSINENTINSVLKEKDNLWIGTAGGGINRLYLPTGEFSHYTYSITNSASVSNNYITSLVRGNDGNLWVGSWGAGLNQISTSGMQIRIQRINPTDANYTNQVVDPFISTLVNDKRGFLLIGTEGGLSVLNYSKKKFTTLLAPGDHIPPLSEIGCALLDSKDYYWIGTRNGLFRFPASSIHTTQNQELTISHLQFYKNRSDDSTSLPGNYIISLMEDSKGYIWIGTYGNGLAKSTVNEQGRLTCTNLSQADGLSNNVTYGIQEDENGNIWISTDYGLSMYRPDENLFRNFYKQDGLLNNQFYWSASYKSDEGELYFGGTEGLNYFKPGAIMEYQYIPTPKISKFKIFNTEVNPGDRFHDKVVITKPIYAADTIYLTYRDNNISFDFSALDYYLPQKTNFAYMMSEIDKEWMTVPAQRRFANYSNLGGGTYTFMLKASNCDGIWNSQPTKITLIITPPFWKTQLFRIIIIVVVLLTTFALIQLQMRRIIQQKRILEEKVRIRTQKIEDQKIILEKQANELLETNHQLERRQKQIELQKEELENKNNEILNQRDELILLNDKVKEINQQQLKFFTNISHEFRTPLTLIISPLERLISKFKNDKDVGNLLHIINRNAQKLLMLINQLLEIRRIETGNQELQVELTETKTFLIEIFDSFKELAGKNEINYQYDIDVNNVAWLDKEKLENVLYNLLSNAFKFTPSGKKITLKASSIKSDGTDFLQIAVIDQGVGIQPNQFEKLFDRFFQVTESKNHSNRGTGIGLSLVKSLIDIMYGKIEVKSQIGEGSIFTIQIPVTKQFFADHEIDTTGQQFESSLRNKVSLLFDQITEKEPVKYKSEEHVIEKILVVEDNPDMRSFICTTLSQYYIVIEAENGREGYELAKKEEPALIISDIMMPKTNGLELCKKIKNNLYTSHIPVILLTAKGQVDDFVNGFEHGADDYISKPFNIEILLAKVNGLIENRKILHSKFSSLEEVSADELTVSNLDHQFFEKVTEIVDKYYTDASFDVDHFASAMFVSRSQLYKKLKAITNLSANDFINVYRLKKSTELLRKGNMQITEIAYATGFNDPKYFSRIFKKFYKCSPSDYLKKK